ncbi:MAG TPA: hypothetical protein VIF09_28915 [Polyangiaceae bacterium]
MIHSGKAIAMGLSCLLVLGAGAVASAQSPDKTAGRSLGPSASSINHKQAQLERDKLALIAIVQRNIDAADTALLELSAMAEADKGAKRERDQRMHKKMTALRDFLADDIGRIERATLDDWKDVRPMVEYDLASATEEQRRFAAMSKAHGPATGVTNKQPKSR